jgi:hypothetical protein
MSGVAVRLKIWSAFALFALVSLVSDVTAQVTRFDISLVESPALDGRDFGSVGRYERLRGVVSGAVDPADPRHADIVNLALAPRNLFRSWRDDRNASFKHTSHMGSLPMTDWTLS